MYPVDDAHRLRSIIFFHRVRNDRHEMVEGFRNRPLDAGPYAYLWLDALVQIIALPGWFAGEGP